jgi:hypothetical protein
MKKTGSQTSAISNAPAQAMYRQHGPATKRVQTSIALYMPPNVSVNYTPNYTDVDVGGFAGAIVGGESDTAAAKKQILRDCGVHVVDSPADLGSKMSELLSLAV